MSQLTSLWHYLIANENFSTAVVGVAASFAGAWGAQIAIFRRDQRREIVATLKSVNEAQALCSTIGNTLMAMKRQHLLAMVEKFRALELEYASLQTRSSAAGQPEILNFAPNLMTLPIVKVPVERLEKTVFERLDIRMEALAATVELGKAFDLLNTSLIGRNDILAKWADGPKVRDDEVMYRYLGIHRPDRADTRYKDFLFAIEKYCEDCIYFDMMVSEAICEYGQKLRRKYRHHIFWRLPKVSVPDFSKAKELGLIPDKKEYERWHIGFKRLPNRREQIKAFFSRKKKPTPAVF